MTEKEVVQRTVHPDGMPLDAIPTNDLIAELDRRNSIYEWTGIPYRARLASTPSDPAA